MSEERSDEDRDATGESRDDRGRLMGVRVDGEWFYRHVPGIVQQLRDATGELVESLERATEARDAFKDERNSAVAEVRSLRGVVQAVEALHRKAFHPIDGIDMCVHCSDEWPCDTIEVVQRVLAAAADAPQPDAAIPCAACTVLRRDHANRDHEWEAAF